MFVDLVGRFPGIGHRKHGVVRVGGPAEHLGGGEQHRDQHALQDPEHHQGNGSNERDHTLRAPALPQPQESRDVDEPGHADGDERGGEHRVR